MPFATNQTITKEAKKDLEKRIAELEDELNEVYEDLIEAMRFDPTNLIYIKSLEDKLSSGEWRIKEYRLHLIDCS